MTVEEWLGENNKIGIDIWHKKYQYNNETFDEWLNRVSDGNDEVERIIREKKFLFAGRTLTNRNTGKKGSYSNCYTRGKIDDNIQDIMLANVDLALTYKAQGGQGLSLSNIRPKETGINSSQFKSDGIIPFMKIYNETTKGISQGGSRKGALIMTLDIWHKESKDFITIKSQEGEIEKANLSLEIDDDFMECVEKYYKTGEVIVRHIERDYNGNKIEYDITPIELYKLMIKTAYDWGEPGCIFTNRFCNYNIMECDPDYVIESPNPCGEQPLPKHGACNLGSINLSEFVINPFTNESYFDFEDFDKTVKIAVEALDDVLTQNLKNHPLPEQEFIARSYRNIGLGIMGMHDMLIKLGLIYGSDKSADFLDKLMNRMFKVATLKSVNLSKQKVPFPCYNSCVFDSEIMTNHFSQEELKEFKKSKLRNASLLSIAPTGTIATMLNVSTGIEPIFRISYDRKTEGMESGKEKVYDIFTGVAKEYIDIYPDKKLPDVFVTANDIKWQDRIKIQSVLQKHVDTGISSTINLPHDISLEEIEQLYLKAWEEGLKGITIFRDRCKRVGVLTDTNIANKKEFLYDCIVPIKREDLKVSSLPSQSYTKRTACGKLSIHINNYQGKLVEVYVNSGKSGGCSANAECIGRQASTALRSGIRVEDVIDATKGVKCSACSNMRGKGEHLDGISCGDAIAKAIEEEYNRLKNQEELLLDAERAIEEHEKVLSEINKSSLKCPDCGEPIAFEGGCNVCKNCGWSKCD